MYLCIGAIRIHTDICTDLSLKLQQLLFLILTTAILNPVTIENDLAWRKGSLSRHKSGLYLLVFIALKFVKSQNRLPFHTTDQVYIC